jgi:hypothetical protein
VVKVFTLRILDQTKEIHNILSQPCALALSRSSIYHSHTNHIDVHYHKINNMVDQQALRLMKIHIDKE